MSVEKSGCPSGLPEPSELLRFLSENGTIDLRRVTEEYQMQHSFLKKHPFAIWQGKNGLWYTYLPGEKPDEKILKKRSKKIEIERLVIDYWQEKEDWPTVRDAFNAYNDRKLELKKIVPASHIRNQYIFDKHFATFGDRKIGKTTPEDWLDFIERQIPEYNMTRKAFSNLKTIIRGMLKLAKRNRLIAWNPEAMFQELDVSDREFKAAWHEDEEEVYTDCEMEKVITYCEDHPIPQNLCIILLYATGLRVGEAVALKREDIAENSVRVRRTETRKKIQGQTGYEYFVKDFPKTAAGIREAVLPDRFAWVLQKILDIAPDAEYVFTADGERILARSIRKYLKAACRETGIEYRPPHKIRKTYGTILLDNAVDERFIIRQMGHTSILTTEKYYHFNRRSLDEKRAILNNIRDFGPYTKDCKMVK